MQVPMMEHQASYDYVSKGEISKHSQANSCQLPRHRTGKCNAVFLLSIPPSEEEMQDLAKKSGRTQF